MTVIIPTPEENNEEFMKSVRERNNATLAALEERKMTDAKPVQSRPGFYAVVSAAVRYNNDLSWMEKMLYVEISALCSKDGYCYASNAYFAKAFNVSARTVTRGITNLADKGFIFTLYETSSNNTLRKIYLRDAAVEQIPIAVLQSEGGVTKMSRVDKNVQHNNTINTNNTNNNSINSINTNNNQNTVSIPPAEAKASEPRVLPPWLGRNPHARLGRLYELLWEATMGVPHKFVLSGKNGSILKNLLSKHSELMVALLMVVHFEWRGLEGKDQFAFKVVRDSGFRVDWLPSRADLYKAYILKNMGLETEGTQYEAMISVLNKLTAPK